MSRNSMKHDKKFLIIGSKNAITYKEIFPLIKENRMWLGVMASAMAKICIFQGGGGLNAMKAIGGVLRTRGERL